jgi:hypothetical protein
MKHRITIEVPVKKRTLFGFTKTVMEKRTVVIDGKTYRQIKKEWNSRPYSIEEMMFYDELFGD